MADRKIPGNAAQMQAIQHLRGPAMVLAGPGSGKTFVIAQRIRYLTEFQNIDPSQILTITYTKAAAAEMRRRFLKLTDSRYPEAAFGTFHSVFYQILRTSAAGASRRVPEIIPEAERQKIMRMILTDLHARIPSVVPGADLAAEYLSEIGRLKSEGKDAQEALPDLSHREVFPEVWSAYRKMLSEMGRYDFDDLITECLRLFREDPRTLDVWRRRFQWILVDEYQDINRSQFEVMQLLSAPADNLFVVGDDDQSIYGFRGSRPDFMLRFREDYPDAKVILLNVNYRSAQEIIDASASVIRQNKTRFDKETRAGREGAGLVRLQGYPGKKEENDALFSWLRERRDALPQTAVIVRTNALAMRLEEEAEAAGIPVFRGAARRKPAENKELADLSSYLRLAGKHPSQEDFYHVMNRPQRYLSRECMRSAVFSAEEMLRYYKDRPSVRKTAERFSRDLEMLSRMRPALAIRYIRGMMGYDGFVRTSGEYKDPEAAIRRMDLLQEEAGGYAGTEAFLRVLAEREEKRDRKGGTAEGARDGVRFMTMHASKGLEFDAVWLPELNEGTVPSKKCVLPEQLEEERRLLYVAMTRARKELILSWHTGGENYVCAVSRYLRPLMRKGS